MDSIKGTSNPPMMNSHTPQPMRPPSFSAQRPLIDVARNYCNTFTAWKENYSTPPVHHTQYIPPAYEEPSRFSWRAAPSLVPGLKSPATESISKPPNPYSWKASGQKSPLADSCSPSESTTSSMSPRPPKIYLSRQTSKMEPLTVSVSMENHPSSPGLSPQSPLQPFSPSSDSTGCPCLRSPKLILCKSCGEIQKGRLSLACPVHPRQVFLMDLSCCTSCKSTNLKEICDAKNSFSTVGQNLYETFKREQHAAYKQPFEGSWRLLIYHIRMD